MSVWISVRREGGGSIENCDTMSLSVRIFTSGSQSRLDGFTFTCKGWGEDEGLGLMLLGFLDSWLGEDISLS